MSNKLVPAFALLRAWLAGLRPWLRDPLRALPLPRALVEVRCARRLDRLAGRVLRLRGRIDAMAARLDADPATGAPADDADGDLRRMLSGLRADLRKMRCDLAYWHLHECGGRSGLRLATALARLNRVAVETQEAALQLERELESRHGA